MALLCDGQDIWGLGIPRETYDPNREDLFELRFTSHYKWELLHADNIMVRVEYRRPRLPVDRFDRSLFRDHLERIFQVDGLGMDALTGAVEEAVEQKHGALVIITVAAAAESSRLAAQSSVIEAELLGREIMRHISRIDGAVLVSPDGLVHAFGVILDGAASSNGDPKRGSRYNSALRYVDGQSRNRVPCFAVIVSEDGYVNLYPELKPRVLRSRIRNLLDVLQEDARADLNFNPDSAWQNLRELDGLRFYLLAQDVERANAYKAAVLRRIEEARAADVAGTGLGYLIPPLPDFKLSPEMSDAYYMPES